MSDPRTLAVYEARAADYAARFAADGAPDADLRAFVEALPEGGRVLDLGCGPGRSAGLMAEAGLVVEAWDASPAMVRLAGARPGVEARLARFGDLRAASLYDGVWANFSLLHAPRAALPAHLAAIARALRPGGRLHLGMKTGRGEERDALGRLYVYWEAEALRNALEEAGLRPLSSREGEAEGLAGGREPFVIWRAERPRG